MLPCASSCCGCELTVGHRCSDPDVRQRPLPRRPALFRRGTRFFGPRSDALARSGNRRCGYSAHGDGWGHDHIRVTDGTAVYEGHPEEFCHFTTYGSESSASPANRTQHLVVCEIFKLQKGSHRENSAFNDWKVS